MSPYGFTRPQWVKQTVLSMLKDGLYSAALDNDVNTVDLRKCSRRQQHVQCFNFLQRICHLNCVDGLHSSDYITEPYMYAWKLYIGTVGCLTNCLMKNYPYPNLIRVYCSKSSVHHRSMNRYWFV